MSENETSQDDIESTESSENSGSDYISDRKFSDFPISQEMLKGILEKGYVHATPVQAATIDSALAGKDLLVRAKTGTGKTAAFSIPALEATPAGVREARVLMLAPTRELAQQIAAECEELAKYKDLRIAVLVGGLAIGPQEDALKDGAEILIGTPGRVMDHCKRGNADLSTCAIAILDEADEMLSMGFYKDVTAILDRTAKERQVLLFSATISDDTERLVSSYLKDHENIRLSTDADNVELIEHVLYETSPKFHKIRSLLFLLDLENPTSAIIFCNTREDTATVATFLDRQGLDVQLLSGELSQGRRSQVMAKIKSGEVKFLVATDVAARGIDISNLSHVINYSLPQDASVYLHRSGRTGRIGNEGTVINLVGGADMGTRKTLVNVHEIDFVIKELPGPEECIALRVERQSAQIKEAMGTLVFETYMPTVRALKARPDGDMLLAACMRAFFQWQRERRAAAGGVDSLTELRNKRHEKADREAEKRRGGRSRDGGRGRDRDDRGGRGRDRDDRGGRGRDRDDRPKRISKSSSKSDIDDLDALLSAGGPAKASAPDKPKSKRKRKPKKKSAAPAAAKGALDDLDALLSSD